MNKPKKIHMVGNAHIDPVWQWRWPEGSAEIKATFRSALDRMNEYEDFTFISASASFYECAEKDDPAMFEEIKQRVAEGRWDIAGGWWVEADTNIPSGESLARHALYSQRYFKEKFGKYARVGVCVDSFGQNSMLPQLLSKSGMPYYTFMRGSDYPDNVDFGRHMFTWESADGSSVLAFRLYTGYNSGRDKAIEYKVEKTLALMVKFDYDFLCFYGVGNHGGGPTITNINDILAFRKKMGSSVVDFNGLDAYFDFVAAKKYDLPVYTGDINHESPGCYTSHVRAKQLNRRSEQRLLAAEKMASLASMAINENEPQAELQRAWKRVLFNQFHDVITGVSIKEVYEDVLEWFGEALSIGNQVTNDAIQKICWNIDTEGDVPARHCKEKPHPVMNPRLWEEDDRGVPLVVFNPLSWEVKAPIQVRTVGVNAVSDTGGALLPVQIIRGSQYNGNFDTTHTLFMGSIPAYGYQTYWLYQKAPDNMAFESPFRCEGGVMENEFIRMEIDGNTGYMNELTDKRTGKNVLAQPACVPVVIDEGETDAWGHDVFAYREQAGVFGEAVVTVIDRGPVRAWTRVMSRYGDSWLRQDLMLHAGSELVEVRVRVDWREKHKMLKLSFPVATNQPRVTYEIPYGILERKCDGTEQPAQNWADLGGKCADGGEAGLAIITDSKYGYDATGNDLRLTVIRSHIYAENRNTPGYYDARDVLAEYIDQGVHEFRYWLRARGGKLDAAATVKRALECNTEAIQVAESYHKGALPLAGSAISVSAANVVVTVFKRAEDGGGYILRGYETAGNAIRTRIELPLIGRSWEGFFGGHEIKTLFIPDDEKASIEEKNLVEVDI